MNIIDLAIELPIELPSEEASEPFLSVTCELHELCVSCELHELCVSCELLCINWNEPTADAYLTQAAFQRGLSTSCWVQTESARNPQCQSRICYQECGCHL